METIIEISKGLLTPLIAIMALYIAWQQWKINKQRLSFELYEKRFHIYKALKKILDIVVTRSNVSMSELQEFRLFVSDADFLFGPEIPKYLDKIFKHGIELQKWCGMYEYINQATLNSKDYDHEIVTRGMEEECIWFSHQYQPAKDKFRKYLSISK